jgi:hypothetical protein
MDGLRILPIDKSGTPVDTNNIIEAMAVATDDASNTYKILVTNYDRDYKKLSF